MYDGSEPIFYDPEQLALLPLEGLRFDGPVYDKGKDFKRLTGQIRRVKQILLVGDWLTLEEIQERTKRPEKWKGDPHTSVAAQLRNLRKARFGGHVINKQRRGDAGLWEYRMEGTGDGR